MLQRPKVGETEEDLLEQEEDFLRQSGKEPTQKRNAEVNPGSSSSSPKVSVVVGEVVERNQGSSVAPGDGDEAKGAGFPALFEIDPNFEPDKTGKKSLFALHIEKNKDDKKNESMEVDDPESSTGKTGAHVESGEDILNVSRSMENEDLDLLQNLNLNENEEPEDVLNVPGRVENNDHLQDMNMEANEESKDVPNVPGSMENEDLDRLQNLNLKENEEPEDVLNVPGRVENNDRLQDVNVEANEQPEDVNAPRNVRNDDLPQDVLASVHRENLARLSRMPEAGILEAQRTLHETLSPEMVDMLRSRAKSRDPERNREPQPRGLDVAEGSNSDEDVQIRETMANYIGDRWMSMDYFEREKLEWIGDITNSVSLELDKPYSARFNFRGELQPYIAEINVTTALYHHGEEPARPGYTIQELYQLARSSVTQQRKLALNTLANIIQKTKLGRYDFCFDGFLLHKLLEADFFLLLRFSIDENTLIPAAMNCLRKLLYNDSDEYCLDRLNGVTNDDVQPLLFDDADSDSDTEEERELGDNAIIQCDLIKGALRTDLLERITYILTNFKCDRETIANAFMCIIRIARHSTESCMQILKNTKLLNFIYGCINCRRPIHQAARLLSLLTGHSQDMADEVFFKYDMNFMLSYLNLDAMSQLSKREFFLLKLECINLWKSFVRSEYMVQDFICWTPCFIRIIEFYIENVDIYGESDFDFEFFSALMSLLRLCVRDGHPVDVRYQDIVAICLEKWMKQLLQFPMMSYSAMKALGSCLAYYVDFFGFYEVDDISHAFITKLNEIIMSAIPTPGFDRLATRLIEYSHILAVSVVRRDPRNLPSLCSVYKNGEGFVRIVNERSAIAFFIPFVKYLKFGLSILPEGKINVKLFLRCPSIRKYVTEIIKLNKHSENWFNQYETELLSDMLQLFCEINDEFTLKLGFRLLPMLRVDNQNFKSVLSVITDTKNWSCDEDIFESIADVFVEYLYKPPEEPTFVLPFSKESAGEDWMYKILTLSRGKEAVAEVAKVLRFITFILSHNSQLLERVPYTVRYYHLCSVFLTDENVFDDEIQMEMQNNFDCILWNREKVNLEMKVDNKRSFYDLYTEMVTQYAGVSYGLPIFAEMIVFPLQNRFNPAYRKLLWFEYHHALRVITLPYPATDYIDMKDFVEPCETDHSLLVAYLDSIAKNVILKNRNAFVYNVAVANVRNFLRNKNNESKLYKFLIQKIGSLKNDTTRRDLLG